MWIALLVIAAVLPPAQTPQKVKAQTAMTRAQSPSFELIAPCRKDQCVEILRLFEWARLLFEKNFQFQASPRRTLIFVSRSYEFWQRLGPDSRNDGFYANLPARGHIVLRSLTGWQQTGLHEFAHLWLRQKMTRHVAWFDEGIACYFEGVRAENGRIEVGLPVPGRLRLLQRERWLPPEKIFEIRRTSEFTRELDVGLFYSQSWALVHMMRLSPEFSPRFAEFLNLMAGGTEASEAMLKTYGVSPPQLLLRARQWIDRGGWPAETLEAPERAQLEISISPASEAEIELVETTLAAARQPAPERARAYEELVDRVGAGCPHQLPLGDLAFNLRLLDQASRHYHEAIRCGVPAAEIGRGMELAAAEMPSLSERQLQEIERLTNDRSLRANAAAARFLAEDYEGVLSATEDLSNMRRDAAFRASRIRAMALIKLERFDEAEILARRLAETAGEDFEHQSARLLLEDVGQQRRAAMAAKTPMHEIYLRQLQRADGVITRIDCMGSWVRLWVRTKDGGHLRLRIADPREVVTGEGEGEAIDLQCGPQQRRAVIGYQPEEDAASGTQGRVKYFRPAQ